MASVISAGTTTTTSLSFSGDTSGVLQLQTNGTTAALTIDTSQNVTFTGKLTSASSLVLASNGTTTAVTIDTSQNMGLGVTPSAWRTDYSLRVLQVGPVAAISSLTAGTTNNQTFFSSNLVFGSGGTYSRIYADWGMQYEQTSGQHLWSTTSTQTGSVSLSQLMTLDNSGNWGLGDTTVSNQRQHVKTATADSSAYAAVWIDSSSNNLFYVRNDGAGYLKASSWSYGSDLSLKENISYLTPQNCLAKLLNAKPATFDFINGEKQNYGYIANDVETWLPEAVSMLESGTRGLKDGFINVLSTGAIQALNQTIQELSAKVTALEAKVA